MSDSQRSDNNFPAGESAVRWTRLSEQEALRILMQPLPPDRFAILNRRGRRLSDTQIVQILQEPANASTSSPASPTDCPPPLPLARHAHLPAVPLNYRNRTRDAHRWPETPLAALPLGYRILRVAVWAAVAVAMLVVMIHSL